MKLISILLLCVFSIACGNDSRQVNADSSNVITDSAALMNTDTTSVIGSNHIGNGQMRTDTPMTGGNVGK